MSDYSSFEVMIDPDDGSSVPVAGAVVQVRDFTDPDAIVRLVPDLVADGDGVIAAGSLAVAAGSHIRFTWLDADSGLCGFAEAVTV